MTANLDVDRSELATGLRLLARQIKPAHAGQAILRFEGGQLAIQVGGGEICAKAAGRWPGEARVSGAFIFAIAKHLPSSDPVALRIEAGRLHIATTSMACEWQAAGTAQVIVSIDAPLAEILRIGLEHSDDELEKSGILGRVKDARARRNELVEKAAKTLEPLRLARPDLERLLDDCIRNAK